MKQWPTNKAWIYNSGGARKKLRELVKRVFKAKGFPEDRRENLIIPIYKRERKRESRQLQSDNTLEYIF